MSCGNHCWHILNKDNNGRTRLPPERISITLGFELEGIKGSILVGFYPCGCIGEIFIKTGSEGELVRGLLDGFATMASIALQYGAPPHVLFGKCLHMSFSPSGFTGDRRHTMAKSILDYIAGLMFSILGNEEENEHEIIKQLRAKNEREHNNFSIRDIELPQDTI